MVGVLIRFWVGGIIWSCYILNGCCIIWWCMRVPERQADHPGHAGSSPTILGSYMAHVFSMVGRGLGPLKVARSQPKCVIFNAGVGWRAW